MKFSALSLASLIAAVVAQAPLPSLTELLSQNNASLSSLTTYLSQFPDVVSQLGSARNITILAPSNQAFEKLLASPAAAQLASNPNLIKAVLTYHVLTGTIYSGNITNTTQFVPTLLNDTAYANITGGQRVAAAVVDGKATIYSGLLQKSVVSTANANFTGGTVHVIDSVLTLPVNVSTTAIQANLTSLAGALTKANLVNTVDHLKDVTIFAPSNTAFQAIGSALGTLNNTALTNILTYHVVQGTVGYSSGLQNNTKLKTVNGAELTVVIRNGSVYVNNAKVTTANVLTNNGVVHVIDQVLNPNNTAAANPSVTTGAPAFPGATQVTEVPFASGIPTPTGTVPTNSGPPASPPTSTPNAAPSVGALGPAALFGGAAALLMNL